MHDLSQNRFLVRRRYPSRDFTLNSFLFGEGALEKYTDYEGLISDVRNLLAILGFRYYLSGYNFLARLVAAYLTDDNYDEDASIAEIAEQYTSDGENVCANICTAVEHNDAFIEKAARFMDIPLYGDDCNSISDVVEIVGALFKIFYNSVTDETKYVEPEPDYSEVYKVFFENGEQDGKDKRTDR